MNNLNHCFSRFILFGAFFTALVSAQLPANLTPEMIKQAQSQYGSSINKEAFSSSDRMKQLLSTYQQKKADTLAAAGLNNAKKPPEDAPPSLKTTSVNTTYSMYESLLRGITVNPDSQLTTLPLFGYDVFSEVNIPAFTPSEIASVPADYPINTGDEIIVMLWGRINEEYRLKVSRDGTINIPRIGPVSVAGLPFEVMQQNVLDRVNKIEGVHASISVGELRSVGVYIVGEVTSPGYYTVSSLSNVTNALFAAGGPTKRGSLRNIQFKRNGRLIATIDFYDFLLAGADKSSLRLQPGDVIFVPIIQTMAAIAGNVRRPGLYELKGKTQLNELIKLAGGITPSAWTNRIQIERYIKNQFQIVLDIDSTNQDLLKFEIDDGDIIKLFPILVKDKNAIYLSGNVWRPGKYEFRDGMRIADVIPGYQALLPESYFNYGIILRQNPPSFLNSIIPFSLKGALDDAQSPDNILLQPKDEIVIYNRDFFEPGRLVAIEGAVTAPGSFKLLENMKIRDLILQAGGLREEASPIRGELYRRDNTTAIAVIKKTEFCIECALKDDPNHNLKLERSDRLFIRQKEGWELERKISLSGQFVYPGTYVLFDNETLGDLIERAGGFKKDGQLSASVFSRASVKDLEIKRKEEYLQQLEINTLNLSSKLAAMDKTTEAQAILAQQAMLKDKLSSLVSTGRVVINLTKPEEYKNFSLEDGDSLFIPRIQNTISVIGEVFNPTTFTFNAENRSPRFYLESAGGIKETGNRKHTYVIKANGTIITNKMQRLSSIKLEPGDAVVIPQRVQYVNAHKAFVETMDAIFKMASTLAIIVTVASALNR